MWSRHPLIPPSRLHKPFAKKQRGGACFQHSSGTWKIIRRHQKNFHPSLVNTAYWLFGCRAMKTVSGTLGSTLGYRSSKYSATTLIQYFTNHKRNKQIMLSCHVGFLNPSSLNPIICRYKLCSCKPLVLLHKHCD